MTDIEHLKLPPHSVEAEQSILGALLLDSSCWERIADVLSAKDFYREAHRAIYEQIELMVVKGVEVDLLTLNAEMGDEEMKRVGGIGYLSQIARDTPSAHNVRRYAQIVREKALQRSLLRVVAEIGDEVYQPGVDVDTLLEGAEKRIFELRQKRIRKTPTTFAALVQSVLTSIDARSKKDESEIAGLPTGFADLDRQTAGLQPGDLIIIAGRPSMGKTALAMNVAEHCALEVKKPVMVFSLEMSDTQLVQRSLGSVAKVNQHRLRTGKLDDDEWARLVDAVSTLSAAPVFIEETAALTITELRARARRQKRDNPDLALIVIDYLQLMVLAGKENRSIEIGNITRGLKALAKELELPIICLSQLNRGLEQRTNKRPTMADLRDSGEIEQDADVILFLYRDEVYNEDSPEKGLAEIIIGKQRNGPTGSVMLAFQREITRFATFNGERPRKERKRKERGFTPDPEARQRADIDN